MRLLDKYNRINIPITIATLLISSIAYYFILQYLLVNELDKDLSVEHEEIMHYANKNNSLPETSNYKDQQIAFHKTNDSLFKMKFSSENIYNESESESEPFRRIDFIVKVNGNTYLATVRKSQQETEDIIQMILMITVAVIIFLLLVLFIANRFILGKLWMPFNNTLDQLREFNLSSKKKIALQKTNIDEFNELNKTILLMTEKIVSDYEALKSFTENASHEIQTPLAIIKAKVELLSQSENLDESQIGILQSLNKAATRLSKLNHSLLLLTKLENQQLEERELVNISSVLLRHIENFDELAETKNIKIVKNIAENTMVLTNESLIEILISNILINAIKHNFENGVIDVNLVENRLMVSNSGVVPVTETSKLFERFRKDSTAGDSLGLGLSIIKKICEISGFSVSYLFENKMHIIKIDFSTR